MLQHSRNVLFWIVIIALSGFKGIHLIHDIQINQLALQVLDVTEYYEIDRMLCEPARTYRLDVTGDPHSLLVNRLRDLHGLNSQQTKKVSNLLQIAMLLEPTLHYRELQSVASSDDDLLQFRTGLIRFIHGDADGAIEVWESIRAGNWALGVGDTCRRVDRDDLAITWYRIALQTNSNQGAVYFRLGLVYYEVEDYDNAVPAFLQALAYGHERRAIYEYTGAALAKAGRIEESLSVLKQGLSIYPDSVNLWYWYADLANLAGQFDDSITSYKKILEFSPEDISARLRLARIYLHIGDTAAGEAQVDIALTLAEDVMPSDVCDDFFPVLPLINDADLMTRISRYCDWENVQ